MQRNQSERNTGKKKLKAKAEQNIVQRAYELAE